jgi:DNA-binding CsgD family transcriptional regulator
MAASMTTQTISRARAVAALDMLEALSGPVNSREFGALLMEWSCSLLRADRTSISDLPGADAVAWPVQGQSALRELFIRRSDEHPAILALRDCDDMTFHLRDQWTLRELRRLPIYQDFMRPMGSHDQLAISLTAPGTGLVALGITRVDRGFTEDDRQLLTRLAGPLRQLYRAARCHDARPPVLTAREEQLLRLISAGHTDRMIGRLVGVSQRTVEKHLEAVRTKLGVTSRAAAVARWLGSSRDCAHRDPN